MLTAAHDALLGPLAHCAAAWRAAPGLDAGEPGGSGVHSTAFTIGVIALAAKMARADGRVTTDEVAMFGRVFDVGDDDAPRVRAAFDRAQGDIAGFETYAAQVAGLFPAGDPVLEDLLGALFAIAVADVRLHPDEDAFLRRVAEIFGLHESAFHRVRARYVEDEGDPWRILGVPHGADPDQVRAAYRRLVAQHHPDKLVGAGAAPELIARATHTLARINAAYQRLRAVPA
jgi:DnaJ like chaperone protein